MSELANVSSTIGLAQEAGQFQPIFLRVVKYTSYLGALTAVAAIIYGIAASVFPILAMGAVFLAISLSSLYLYHQMGDLKAIEEDAKRIEALSRLCTISGPTRYRSSIMRSYK